MPAYMSHGVEEHDEQHDKPERKVFYLKKNMTNLLAAFYYCVGCSLVHMAMFITILIVKWPDVEAARKVDLDYIASIRKKDPEFFRRHTESSKVDE